ncbi:MAG: PfkB family carbohydrate kinase [Burkholderiaceae bacterium]
MAAIICLGIVVRDLVFEVPSLPPVPQKLTATSFCRRGGGMAATAAIAAAALGGKVHYWGRLGDDLTGAELRAEMEAHCVRVHAPIVSGTQTPVAAVLVAANGERTLAVFLGQLDDDAGWLPLAEVASVQAVLADFRWTQGARALYQAARAAGIPRVLDADRGDADAVRTLLPLADHAIFSQPGLAELSGTGEVEAGLRNAAATAAGVVGVTLGEGGSAFLIDGELLRIPAQDIVARDTNGAGDVFHGAYTLALAQGEGVIAAGRIATAAAALKCRNGSGWEAVPDRAAVDEFLKGCAW